MARLSQLFAPRDREFFDLFEEARQQRVTAADLLDRDAARLPRDEELAREILLCEQEGDRITHDIVNRLNQTFVTPIDREDILELGSTLDDVIDLTEEVADYLGSTGSRRRWSRRSGSRNPLPGCRQIVRRCRGCATSGTSRTTRSRSTGSRTRAIDVSREAIASLFHKGIDPMVVIRWKDLFERLEAGDRRDRARPRTCSTGS